MTREGQSTNARHRGGPARSSDEGRESSWSKGAGSSSLYPRSTAVREELVEQAKPFCISKRLVWEAFKDVKANKGSAGVDFESLQDFEKDLSSNLYKLWNRMSSGAYFPPPVLEVEIPKKAGGKRKLGIPTVGDRIAQAVVKKALEPLVEPSFHPDSYGYRPGRSALDAVGRTRKRCWQHDWVLDLDISKFFDSLDHTLLMRAVRSYTSCRWVLLYIERWLKAPVRTAEGLLVESDRGTPQGGVISPLLANIYLHFAFDLWMCREHPRFPFERYADDVVIHCATREQAESLRRQLSMRLADCGLELHPEKTRIVYCKDSNRPGDHPEQKFDFLGYTFRPRSSKGRDGRLFVSFSPAVGDDVVKVLRRRIKRWWFHHQSGLTLGEIARLANPVLRGWINYYGRYCKSALQPVMRYFDWILTRWAMKKYRRFRGKQRRASYWLGRVARQSPQLFAHWFLLGWKPTAG